MPQTDDDTLIQRVLDSAQQHGLMTDIRTRNSAFRVDPAGDFVRDCVTLTGGAAKTVAYWSEASNFSHVRRMIVLGPGDILQAHKSDEWIRLEQLEQGQQVYRRLLDHFCA